MKNDASRMSGSNNQDQDHDDNIIDKDHDSLETNAITSNNQNVDEHEIDETKQRAHDVTSNNQNDDEHEVDEKKQNGHDSSETNALTNNTQKDDEHEIDEKKQNGHDSSETKAVTSDTQMDNEHEIDEKKQSRKSNDPKRQMKPGVHTVSRDIFNNVICSDVNRLIAKTRGHASALRIYGDMQQNNIVANHDAVPRVFDTSSVTHTSMYMADGTRTVGVERSVVSTNSTAPVVSSQVRRLIAKSRGDPDALLPFQGGQSNISNINDATLAIGEDNTMMPGAYSHTSTNNCHTTMPESQTFTGNHIIEPSDQISDQPRENISSTENLTHVNGLVVANLVEHVDNSGETMLIPTAVSFDSDTKPKLAMNQHWYLFIVFVISSIIISTIGVVLGIVLRSKQLQHMNPHPKYLMYRETIGIYENIARAISIEELNDIKSSYKMALDWITYDDPLLLTPDHPRFMQRYILSYLYFATSMAGNWTDDCAPASNKGDECKHTMIGGTTFTQPSLRWLSKQNECSWAGITCDTTLQVSGVDLNGIAGTFPTGIMLLPYLHSLTLQSSNLGGSLPEGAIGKHNRMLHILNVQNNSFTGTIPEQWFQSQSLQKLHMNSNELHGTIPGTVFNMMDLRALDVKNNELTGSLPNEFGQMGNLYELYMQNNKFSGTIPSSFGEMMFLQNLDISDNLISGTLPKEIGNMKKNKEFRAARNRLRGPIPEKFWNANQLEYIYLNDNALTGTISNKIQQLKYLSDLSIFNNLFIGTLPARIGNKANGESAYSNRGFSQFRAFGNQLNGTVPEHLCNLIQGGTLRALELDCGPIDSGGGSSSSTGVMVAEITCPMDCCTLCCTLNGTDCKRMN